MTLFTFREKFTSGLTLSAGRTQLSAWSTLLVTRREPWTRRSWSHTSSAVAATVPTPITWQQIREEVFKDKVMKLLADQISDGFPQDRKLLRLELRE